MDTYIIIIHPGNDYYINSWWISWDVPVIIAINYWMCEWNNNEWLYIKSGAHLWNDRMKKKSK